MKKNVCTYSVNVHLGDCNCMLNLADLNGTKAGTDAYMALMNKQDIKTTYYDDGPVNIVIPYESVLYFTWSKTCSETTVENDICQ